MVAPEEPGGEEEEQCAQQVRPAGSGGRLGAQEQHRNASHEPAGGDSHGHNPETADYQGRGITIITACAASQ